MKLIPPRFGDVIDVRPGTTAELTGVADIHHSRFLNLVLPQEQEFHQHLRALARAAVRVVIEEVMREELDQVIGVGWGECSPKRKGYRNGTYTRDLVTSTGRLEDLKVPRDREGQFHTQAFERYSRYEPHIARSA